MRKLLFVDHVFHKKTKSFDFLSAILRQNFEVTHIYVDPEEHFDPECFDLSSEYVVIAQVDFVTPFFIMLGKRVTVVQMYDGSFGLPDRHWILNRQARYLNFSHTLHAKALKHGCESLLVKYAPDPDKIEPVDSYKDLSCFFWNRLPDSEINCRLVGKLLKAQLNKCHVHLPRDDGRAPQLDDVKKHFDCEVTTSEWFENKADFDSTLNKCNVFVAPRIAEGIGHAFLDAMARGMIVLAWDLPTHNEYISNWRNGILFNNTVESISLKNRNDLQKIGRMARTSISNDFTQWMNDKEKICDFVLGCPSSKFPEIDKCRSDVASIMNSYRSGLKRYSKELQSADLTVNMLSNWRDYVDPPKIFHSTNKKTRFSILFGRGNAKYLPNSGFSDAEELFTWTNDLSAKIRFSAAMLPTTANMLRMKIKIRAVRKNPTIIKANGVEVAKLSASSRWNEFEYVFPIASNGSAADISLEIICSKLHAPGNNDTRMLGVAIQEISFMPSNVYSLPATKTHVVSSLFERASRRVTNLMASRSK